MKFFLPAAVCCTLLACNNPQTSSTAAADTTSAAKTTKEQPAEFADPKYADMGKVSIQSMASGDLDAWINQFADNAVYRWSSGDSLAGKTAIANYWKDRRKNVIDSISFSNDIWLPIKVNKPQKGPDSPGNWLLGWYQVSAKYKGGKMITFWVHTELILTRMIKLTRSFNI